MLRPRERFFDRCYTFQYVDEIRGRALSSATPPPIEALGDRIWVVLGGGGVRGVAHAGAWQAIRESGVAVAGIVGTSIGALIGSCVAGGMSWSRLVRLGLGLRKEDIVRINRRVVWVNGIREESVFRGDVLREYIDRVLPEKEWRSLQIPIQMNAVDLNTGRSEWFGIGARTDVPLAEACYASAALGVLYPPARIGEGLFVDGGTSAVLPCTRAADLGATGIIAIDVGSGEEADGGTIAGQGIVAIHDRLFAIMSGRERRTLVQNWSGPPLLYVRPDVGGHSAFAFDKVKYFLEEGHRATRQALESG